MVEEKKEIGVHIDRPIERLRGEKPKFLEKGPLGEIGERGFAKLEELIGMAEEVKGIRGAKDTRTALKSLVRDWRMTGSEEAEKRQRILGDIKGMGERFGEESKTRKRIMRLHDTLLGEHGGETKPGEPVSPEAPPPSPPKKEERPFEGLEFSGLKESLETAENADRPPLEEEMNIRTGGLCGLIQDLKEDLEAGRTIDDELAEAKKEATELRKKDREAGKFIKEIVDDLEKEVAEKKKEALLPEKRDLRMPEARPKGPIKRPELKLDSWMTDEGDKAKPEVVEPREWKEGIPNYGKFDNINQVVYAVRQQLNDAIMRNGWIRPDEAEDRAIRGWLTEAKNLAKEAGGRGTREWRISKDLEKEHQAIREMLAWWHDGVLSHVEPAGRGFEQMQNRGTDFTADLIKWLMPGYRGKQIARALGEPCPMLEITDFENPNVVLAAMLRLGTALGIKDGGVENVAKLKLHDVDQIWVIENPFSINPHLSPDDVTSETEKGTSYLYEMYRIFNLPAYAMKYLDVRHANYIYALELSHYALVNEETGKQITLEGLLELPEDERVEFGWDPSRSDRENREILTDQQVPIFIDHLSAQANLFYTFWQTPDAMCPFWHANILHLEDERKIELGWDPDPDLSNEENLSRLADKDYALMKRNIIHFRAGDIRSEDWEKIDWSDFPRGFPLNAWAKRLNYMMLTMKQMVGILRGKDVREKVRELGAGFGYPHIMNELAFVKDRERMHWSDALSESDLYSFRTFREKGNRHPLATMIRKEIPQGFYRGFLRKFEFLACGIKGMDWALHPERMMREGTEYLAIRQLLQRLSEVKIVREGIIKKHLRKAGIKYEDFANFAGLKLKKLHFNFTPFGRELSATEDLDILEEYFMVSEEERDAWLERMRASSKPEDQAKYRKIKNIHFKGELETEVDLNILREYLALPEAEREQWLKDNYNLEKGGKTEKICQIWAEFDKMTDSERKEWYRKNRRKAYAVRSFIAHWPGRAGWNRMEQGELIMAVWDAIDTYLEPFYEENPKLKRSWFGLWYNLWERETRLFRIIRRQKASMDFRTKDQKRWDDEANEIQAPGDVIVGRYIHDQLEWDEEEQNLIRYEDRMVWDEEEGTERMNEWRGLDRLASMMMGTGEYWPGDPRELSPLYYGHKTRRIVIRYFARQSIGFRLKQAINEARRLGLKLEEYWEAYRPDREVMTPQKMAAIINGLEMQGTIDFNEVPDLMRMFGCTENEWIFFRKERREARVRDIEDKVEAGVEVEYRTTMDKMISQMAGPPVAGLGALVNFVLGGQTGRERGRIVRNAAFGASIPLAVNMAGMLLEAPIIGVPGLGVLVAPFTGGAVGFLTLDRGDQDRGFRWLASRALGTLAREREARRDPYIILRGYQIPGWMGGDRFNLPEKATKIPLIGGILERVVIRPLLVPAVWDDWVDGGVIIQGVTKSKFELGGESAEK